MRLLRATVFFAAALCGWAITSQIRAGALADGATRLPFDKSLWVRKDALDSATPERHFQSLRQVMVADLLARHLRPGLANHALRELLGPPDDLESPASGDTSVWIYVLERHEFGPAIVMLRIALDGQGRVVSCEERNDTFRYK
jgi:hypothetical protein